ncbi:MAG: urate hydroxylase PuuD [Deltaproteobacteria bacterium]|nr:urate hydroxylase PuuD [Deltaproteobacteria bacterium]
METLSVAEVVKFVLRWFHYIFGILWIGHLYFFNFVNANFQAAIDAETKKKIVPELMPRALFAFRWGAMMTFITGWIYFGMQQQAYLGSPSIYWIGLGALFGSVMWFNVWFIIWPNQKKIITAVKTGEKPDPNLVENARKASKLNTFLSMPMLACMAGASHGAIFGQYWTVAILAFIVLGFGLAQHLYQIAPKVGKSV